MPSPARARTLADTPAPAGMRGIRRHSDHEYLGMPLWSIATGADPSKGEIRGHAKGVVAIGGAAAGV